MVDFVEGLELIIGFIVTYYIVLGISELVNYVQRRKYREDK